MVSRDYLSSLIKQEIEHIEKIYGGGNSEVFLAIDSKNDSYCIKKYPSVYSQNHYSRLDREWLALTYLQGLGIKTLPTPITKDEKLNIGVYNWIEGENFSCRGLTENDIKKAVDFLVQINLAKDELLAKDLPDAREAYFSVISIKDNIFNRIDTLVNSENFSSHHKDMKSFLINDLNPFFDRVYKQAIDGYQSIGIKETDELDMASRILSPSDFGFHNAIKKVGAIYWIDFEYFGWDDPAKTIADFILHPAMQISLENQKLFVTSMLDRFKFSNNLPERLDLLIPVFGIKWCVIILNEFLHDGINRRKLAHGLKKATKIQKSQLKKAKSLLSFLLEIYGQKIYT